jgi:hypothetical protein
MFERKRAEKKVFEKPKPFIVPKKSNLPSMVAVKDKKVGEYTPATRLVTSA